MLRIKGFADKEDATMKIRNAYHNCHDNESYLAYKYKQNGKIETGLLSNNSQEEIENFLKGIPDTTFIVCIYYPWVSEDKGLHISLIEERR